MVFCCDTFILLQVRQIVTMGHGPEKTNRNQHKTHKDGQQNINCWFQKATSLTFSVIAQKSLIFPQSVCLVWGYEIQRRSWCESVINAKTPLDDTSIAQHELFMSYLGNRQESPCENERCVDLCWERKAGQTFIVRIQKCLVAHIPAHLVLF